MNRRRRTNTTIFDKLVDEGRSAAVKLVFSTALIGGSSYLLSSGPAEQQNIERDVMKFSNSALEVQQSPLHDVITIGIATANNRSAIERGLEEILTEITRNAAAQHLNSDFAASSDKWLSATMSQLETDRGRVNGFLFTNPLEEAFQGDIVAILDGQRDVLAEIREIIVRWDTETGGARDGRLQTAATRLGQVRSLSSGIESKVQQLMTATKIAEAQSNQTASELSRRSNLTDLKHILAVAGITLGLGLFGWTFVAAARNKQ